MSLPAIEERQAAALPAARSRGRRKSTWARDVLAIVLPAFLGLTVVLLAWEAWVELRNVKPYLLPAPSSVASRLYADPQLFAIEGLRTLEGALLGFVIGAAVAVSLATIMAQSRFLERSIFPLAIL